MDSKWPLTACADFLSSCPARKPKVRWPRSIRVRRFFEFVSGSQTEGPGGLSRCACADFLNSCPARKPELPVALVAPRAPIF